MEKSNKNIAPIQQVLEEDFNKKMTTTKELEKEEYESILHEEVRYYININITSTKFSIFAHINIENKPILLHFHRVTKA